MGAKVIEILNGLSLMRSFTEKVRATIDRYEMLEPGDAVLVGVSGGADSVALLHVLHSLRERYGISLTVAHFNHGLRGSESDRDEQFVRQVADRLGVPLVVERNSDPLDRDSGNIEERARLKRYEFFHRSAEERGSGKIALGHTANDQAETVLLWLLRGTGRKGLGGMPPVREGIVRPFIDTERSDIVEYLTEGGIAWVEDGSNQEPAFTRNRIRHRLIPQIQEEFEPQVVPLLSSTAELLRDEESWLEQITQTHFQALAKEADGERVAFAIDTLASLPKALQRRLTRYALESVQGSLRKIGRDHVEAVLALIYSDSPHAEVCLPGGLGARREYGMLQVGKIEKEEVSFCYSFDELPAEVAISEIGRTISFEVLDWTPGCTVPRTAQDVVIDRETVNFPLVIRSMKQGDRFNPLGVEGSKKIKDFFIDQKVPYEKRHKVPIVAFGSVIAWVAGYRIDDRTRVTDRTRTAVRMVMS